MMKIAVVTATRAEYGLLVPLMKAIQKEADMQLQILVTGAHLEPAHGATFAQIEQDGFKITVKVPIDLKDDSPKGITNSMGLALQKFGKVFQELQPDFLVILGDRYEMLAMASAATIFKIPIIHLHGGEITEGAYDDAIRHAITKLSHLHFTATEAYRQRVIQLGEQPERVFNVGAIGLDNIRDLPLLSKETLEKELEVSFQKYNYQVTFHPETLANISATEQFQQLLEVINHQEESFFIFTKANADTDGHIINEMIDAFVLQYPEKAKAFHSLGTLRFLSLVKFCDAIVGNSSSGIIEAPSLKTATINIGDRQKGRIQAESVVNVGNTVAEIQNAFVQIKKAPFNGNFEKINNPYDNGGAVIDIIKELKKQTNLNTNKSFYNL